MTDEFNAAEKESHVKQEYARPKWRKKGAR
jgi:hypothetical protein